HLFTIKPRAERCTLKTPAILISDKRLSGSPPIQAGIRSEECQYATPLAGCPVFVPDRKCRYPAVRPGDDSHHLRPLPEADRRQPRAAETADDILPALPPGPPIQQPGIAPDADAAGAGRLSFRAVRLLRRWRQDKAQILAGNDFNPGQLHLAFILQQGVVFQRVK